MDYTHTTIILFMPLFLFTLTVILVLSLRWFSHKERMALIQQGLPFEVKKKNAEETSKTLLASGLAIALIGLALALGLFTLGLGPWLLAGLIPLFVGLVLILVSLIIQPEKPKEKQKESAPEPAPELTPDKEEPSTIPMEEKEEEDHSPPWTAESVAEQDWENEESEENE